MRPLTRRHALHGAVALLTGFAGCSGSNSSSSSSDGPRNPENAVTDPDQYALRSSEVGAVVRRADDETDTPTEEEEARQYFDRQDFVASRDDADALTFADVDGVDGAKAFLTDTDFSRETVYIEQQTIGECYELELCWLTWSATDIQTDYGRQLRDADVACEADDEDVVATFIRIPDKLDPDEISGYGSGMSSSGCRIPPHIQDASETGTPAGDTTEAS